MPGFMTHYILGIKMYQDIPDTLLKESIHRHKNLFRLGLQGPDFLFAYPRDCHRKKGEPYRALGSTKKRLIFSLKTC